MATVKTYDVVGNREDLIDVITNISPDETPFYSAFGKTKANATYHEWQTDELASPTQNAHVEGSSAATVTHTARTRLGNYIQSFKTGVSVSDVQRAVTTAGVADEFARQLSKKLKEHARDIEYAIVNGTGKAGSSSVAAELKGVSSFITTNTADAGGSALTEETFNDMVQTIREAGGKPDIVYVNGYQKRQIDAFTAGAVKSVEQSEKKLTNRVEIYDSTFGRLRIQYHWLLPTSSVVFLQSDLWKVAKLIPTKKYDLTTQEDSTKAEIRSYLTLEALSEAGSGMITNLATS